MNEDDSLYQAFSASDIDNDSLTYKLTTNPSNGSVVLNDNGKGFDYTPNANYNGPDSFKYVANDGSLDSEEAVVSLTINPVNDPVSIEKIVSGDTNLFVDNSSEITVSGDTILDKAFSPDLPDFYSYSLELEDIDQSDQIYLSKSGGDNFGQLDFDNLGSGDRFATFTYTPANSNPLSSVVTENYTISASDRQDNTGSSDSHQFQVNVIGSGLGNNLNINSSNSGSIDGFSFSGLNSIDLQGGDDIASLAGSFADIFLGNGSDKAFLSSNASGKIDGGSDVDTLYTQASFNSDLVGGSITV